MRRNFVVEFNLRVCSAFFLWRLWQCHQAAFPIVELVFIAPAEKDLAHDEVRAVVIVVHHPVGDVVNVAAFYFVLDRVVDVQAGDFDNAQAWFVIQAFVRLRKRSRLDS